MVKQSSFQTNILADNRFLLLTNISVIHLFSLLINLIILAYILAAIKPTRKKEADRMRSLNIERWLKKKFREGFATMKVAFEKEDEKNEGMVGGF